MVAWPWPQRRTEKAAENRLAARQRSCSRWSSTDAAGSTSPHGVARRCIAPDGPDSVLRALKALGNPRRALDALYDLVDGLVAAVEAHFGHDCALTLYMGETFRVWLDSWQSVRKELKRDNNDAAPYDLSKIPEIFDKVRFDARHNARKLDLRSVYPRFDDLVSRAKTLSAAQIMPLSRARSPSRRRSLAAENTSWLRALWSRRRSPWVLR